MPAIPPRHKWLLELTHLPTTSGKEQRVVEWVEGWVGRRSDLTLKPDQAGNLLITIKGRKRRAPVIAAAHMDHPGFVIESVDRRMVNARFMGGVMEPYFDNAAVEFFDANDEPTSGRIVEHDHESSSAVIRLARAVTMLQPGDIGRWRFPANRLGIRGDLLRAPGCDDLAGVASALAAIDQARKKPDLAHFGVLLTRAEEEGFIGAIGACKLGTVPTEARLLSIETSRSFPDSPIGGGPVVRVGDRASIFDHALTNSITDIARSRKIAHQRKLMDGGTCEATAFVAYGHRASGLCLPLGNYHNMVDIDGVREGGQARLGPEFISLADYDGLVGLMLAVARDLDQQESSLADRLDRRYEGNRHLLG
jgi:endoglucanase